MIPEMHEYFSCFDHRYMKRKEEIKTQYILRFVLPLDGKDPIDFLPRNQERYASFKGTFWRDIWFSNYCPQSADLVSPCPQ